MKSYLITVKVWAPYPVESSHRISASSAATACARAIREAEKKVAHKRRITNYTVSAAKS